MSSPQAAYQSGGHRRQASLSESRSAPNLSLLDTTARSNRSPQITVDSGTPGLQDETAKLRPQSPQKHDGEPRRSSDSYADGEQEDGDEEEEEEDDGLEEDEDEDFADFLFGSDEEDLQGVSSASTSASSTASSRRSSLAAKQSAVPSSTNGTAWRPRSSAGGASNAHAATMLGRSQSHVQLTSFAPPFYNRPPLPLPPSPSLTSLLRPSFSATPSRPTTPDDSENDTPNDTEAGVAKAARTATTVPRAAPKVPTYEYYGFVLYLSSSAGMAIYVLWSFLPSPFLHALGIDYYPNRWWSLAIPAQLVATLVYVYIALACYNTEVLTLPLTHPGCFVDDAAHVAVLDARGRIARSDRHRQGGLETSRNPRREGKERNTGKSKKKERARREQEKRERSRSQALRRRADPPDAMWDWRAVWSEGTDAVMDVPVGGVCEILYGG